MNISQEKRASLMQLEGLQYFNNKNHEKALEYFSKAIQLDPTNAQYYIDKGSALYNLGKYNEAIESYNKAIELDSSDEESFYHKGFVLYKLGQYDEALQSINIGLNINNEHILLQDLKNQILSR